jgi:hypothetical protein
MTRQSHHRPSSTRRITISVAADLLLEFDEMRRDVETDGISLSRYLVTAAILCHQLGIDDPESPNLDALPAGDLDLGARKNGHVSAGDDVHDALDTMLDIQF